MNIGIYVSMYNTWQSYGTILFIYRTNTIVQAASVQTAAWLSIDLVCTHETYLVSQFISENQHIGICYYMIKIWYWTFFHQVKSAVYYCRKWHGNTGALIGLQVKSICLKFCHEVVQLTHMTDIFNLLTFIKP